MAGLVSRVALDLAGAGLRSALVPGLLQQARSLSAAAPQPSTTQSTGPLPKLPPFDHTPAPYTGPSAEEVLATRKKFLSPCELCAAGRCEGRTFTRESWAPRLRT